MTMLFLATLLLCAYLLYAAVRLGFIHRVPLVLGHLSMRTVVTRAEQVHGERALFTTDTDVAWEVAALRDEYPDPRAWSARRIARTASRVAAMLRVELDVCAGDRVALMKQNHLDMHVLMSGIVQAGGIACPVNGRFLAAHVGPYLGTVGAVVLVSDVGTLTRVLSEGGALGDVRAVVLAEGREDVVAASHMETLIGASHPLVRVIWIEEALRGAGGECPPVGRDDLDPLYLVHTSGTTGFPKAVTLRNGPVARDARVAQLRAPLPLVRPRAPCGPEQPPGGDPVISLPAPAGPPRPLGVRLWT